ncbi:LysM peptidoglycan-binding domain-containing protein [Flavobacterium sp.]|uniref:C40 family peptidase n=1 Tax=Flavobacterium sp. TaxID=239 RepID=UPI003752DA09
MIKHNVKSGESIYFIAKKYDVSESEIYALNPKLKGAVLALKAEVKVPNKKFKQKVVKKVNKEIGTENKEKKKNDTTPNVLTQVHIVKPKETLYSISKKYEISMELICEMNPELKTGNLKIGSKLKLPNQDQVISNPKIENEATENTVVEQIKTDNIVSNVDVVHKVLPKETLYGISKQTGVSVSDLQALNPSIASGLPVGFFLIVKKGLKEVEADKTAVVVEKIDVAINDIPESNSAKADFLIAKAVEHIGTPYRSGGTTSAGFDCSGFMFATFKNIDMTLPRASHEQANYGVQIDKSMAQKGDLIFFATRGKGRISHVGMITEIVNDEIKFIHSSTSSGVIISSIKEDYYARTFVQINRVLTLETK